MSEVVCIGEILIDFVSENTGFLKDSPGFKKCPGGAPANVAVGLSRLGIRSGFAGKVGDDGFGKFLINTLKKYKVDTGNLILGKDFQTPLAFVSLQKNGERDFTFYGDICANLKLDELQLSQVKKSKILHFGTISMLKEPFRNTTKRLIKIARKNGIFISFDPNIRAHLWKNKKKLREEIEFGIENADLVKLSAEELEFTMRIKGLKEASEILLRKGPKIVVVTLGSRGAYYNTGEIHGKIPGFKVKAIDTTGAGDGFVAGLLSGLVNYELFHKKDFTKRRLDGIIRFSNAVGALTTTSKGAISALPDLKQVREKILEKELL